MSSCEVWCCACSDGMCMPRRMSALNTSHMQQFCNILASAVAYVKYLACITSELAGQQHTHMIYHCFDAKLTDGLMLWLFAAEAQQHANYTQTISCLMSIILWDSACPCGRSTNAACKTWNCTPRLKVVYPDSALTPESQESFGWK